MNAKVDTQETKLDGPKLTVAALVAAGGLAGFYLFPDQHLLVRVVGLLVVLGIAAAIALTTARGRGLMQFLADTRMEVRKVVWPGRTETTQTTLLVVVLVDRTGSVTMAMRWYVVHAFSGYENQVKRSLLERIAMSGLEDQFGDILVPTEEVVEMRGGTQRKSERKFFPGYVLVQMEMNEGTWHLVKDVPRVMGFIGGTGDKPAPLSPKEADSILQRIQEGVEKPKPKVLYEPGEVVRVNDGPFTDFNGVVEEVNYEKSRVRVAVLIFGRSTPVELEFGQVEKA
jgi:transcriptional antiterminator NusG